MAGRVRHGPTTAAGYERGVVRHGSLTRPPRSYGPAQPAVWELDRRHDVHRCRHATRRIASHQYSSGQDPNRLPLQHRQVARARRPQGIDHVQLLDTQPARMATVAVSMSAEDQQDDERARRCDADTVTASMQEHTDNRRDRQHACAAQNDVDQ